MPMDISHATQLLEAESKELESLLLTIGKKEVVGGATEWIPKPVDLGGSDSDQGDLADEAEEIENRTLVEEDLVTRLTSIKAAITRIQDGTYGKCEKCGEDIPDDRLEANPAADTCIDHA